MAEMTVILEYGETAPNGDKVLFAASQVLKILKEIEKAKTGKKAQMTWAVNIYSLSDRAVIEFTCINATRAEARAIAEEAQGREVPAT